MASEGKLEKADSIHFTDADFLLDFADLTLEKQIGAGNFAAVWQGTYRSGPVAIKRQTLFEKELDKYLEKEMAILKTVSHPNLLRFIGACREGKHVYIVTELLEANLEEVLDRKDVPLGWRLRVEIAHECASALA